jgi:hypothetical protein
VDVFRKYSLWNPATSASGGPSDSDRNRDFVFLHDNFVVTQNIFVDEKVIYDQVTPPWIEFCRKELNFVLPQEANAAPLAALEPPDPS